MRKYGTLFTWAVIEDEIMKLAEKEKILLQVNPKSHVREWKPSRKSFKLEQSTIWRFFRRGDWAVHDSRYRGNWAPQVPRNLILKYSKRGQTVLDSFVGGGTTLIECWLEGRNGIGVDASPWAVEVTRHKLAEMRMLAKRDKFELPKVHVTVRKGDARKLNFISSESIDLICAHPPYFDSLRYTRSAKEDLSQIHDLQRFNEEIGKVACELYRVLKRGRICAVLIGDVRRNGEFIPLERYVSDEFAKAGFKLKERIIKEQHHDGSTSFYLDMTKTGKHWIAHEYLLIFKKSTLKT